MFTRTSSSRELLALGVAAGHVVTPDSRIAGRGEQIAPGGTEIQVGEERGVRHRRRTKMVETFLSRTRLRGRSIGGVTGQVTGAKAASRTHPDGHLVAESAVEVRDARDRLHKVAALPAPRVQHGHLLSHQPAASVVRVSTD
jgi:hypothetical protein